MEREGSRERGGERGRERAGEGGGEGEGNGQVCFKQLKVNMCSVCIDIGAYVTRSMSRSSCAAMVAMSTLCKTN